MGILIDASNSIQSHYDDYITVINGLISSFSISKDQSHIGVSSFTNNKNTIVGLNEHLSQESFKTVFPKLPKPDGNSALGLALETSYKSLFEDQESRLNVPKVVLLATDGFKKSEWESDKNPVLIAKELREKGVSVNKPKCF